MNSLYDLCEYGYKIKDVDKLKEYKITVKDVCVGKAVIKDYKCRKAYLSAQKIYKNHNDVFNNNSIYELYEYGISAAIINSIRIKVTIDEICKNSDRYLKERYNIKYNTLAKIRKCGYFNNSDDKEKEDENNNYEYEKIIKLRDYGATQSVINKIISRNIQIENLLNFDVDNIIKELEISKPTACKLENVLERYRIKNKIKKPLEKIMPLYLQQETKYRYISIDNICNEFQDYEDIEIDKALKNLLDNGIINKKDNLYRYNFFQLKKINFFVKKDKLKDMIEMKLQGKNCQEIGDKYGITRERVRQIMQKNILDVIFQEDIYKDIVEEYNFTKKEFVIIFEESEETYEYLKYKYEFGEKTVEQFLEDYPEYLNEEKNEKLLVMNKEVIYNNCKVKLNYTEIIRVYVKSLNRRKTLEEILKELNIDFERFELPPINEKYLEGRLAKIDNVICGIGKKYKYIDYINISEEKIEFMREILNKLPDGYYSTLKLFNENKDFFKSINIEDEYEVHNLLRRLFNGKMTNCTFTVMPSFFIGDIDVKQFFFELIKKYEPIGIIGFLNIIEKDYGHKKAHVRNILTKYFDNYIVSEIINIKMLELNEEEINLIKEKMKKELYNIESFYNILKLFFKDNYLEYVNNSNLNKLRLSFNRKLYFK